MWVIDRMRMGPGQAAGWLRERGASGVGLAWRQSLLTVGGFHLHVKHLYFPCSMSHCHTLLRATAPATLTTSLHCLLARSYTVCIA